MPKLPWRHLAVFRPHPHTSRTCLKFCARERWTIRRVIDRKPTFTRGAHRLGMFWRRKRRNSIPCRRPADALRTAPAAGGKGAKSVRQDSPRRDRQPKSDSKTGKSTGNADERLAWFCSPDDDEDVRLHPALLDAMIPAPGNGLPAMAEIDRRAFWREFASAAPWTLRFGFRVAALLAA